MKSKRGKYRWAVRETKTHGISVGGVYADNWKEALRKAARIGFKNPDSVALDQDGSIQRRWTAERKAHFAAYKRMQRK